MKKTQSKRWISLLLAIWMVASVSLFSVSALPAKAADDAEVVSGTCGENVTWTFNKETGELTISGTGEMEDYTSGPDVPWFSSYYGLERYIENVIITDGVTTISSHAFSACQKLTSVTIPDSVKRIGDFSFIQCYKLSDITLPNSVESIGNYAFGFCNSLAFVHIPASVTFIGSDCFSNCPAYICSDTADCYAKTYADANGIEFRVCGTCGENLTWTLNTETGELTISGTGKMDDYDDLFNNSPWTSPISIRDTIKDITISDGVTSIGKYAFSFCTKLTNVTIPDSVTTIGICSFEHCWALTDITIPDNVTTIDQFAFFYCTSLKKMTIPSSVTSIGYMAFNGCENLTAFTVDANNPAYCSSADGVLYNKDKTILVQYPIGNSRNAFTIPDSVTTIGNNAFYDCVTLTSVTIPDSVTTIGGGAFFGCKNLTDVTIPDSVTTIDGSAFYGCESLTSMTIPFSVTSIGDYAFCDCKSLDYIHIPKSVKHIGSRAFTTSPVNGVSGLLSLYICSSTADCFAKMYADRNGIEFRICTEHDPAISIRNFVSEKTVDYRVTLTFTADVENTVDGAVVHWFINGEEVGTGDSCTVSEATKDFTVQAKYIKDGTVLAESETETVNVKSGFFDRLVAFFRILFEKLAALAKKIFGVKIGK